MRAAHGVLASLLVASGLVVATVAQSKPATPIVPPDAKLELLFTRSAAISGGLTEGAAVAPDGSIYFSDIPTGADHGMILRFDPKTRKTTVFSDDSGKANGLMFDAHGYLIACEGSDAGGRRVSRWDVKTGTRTTLADRYHGKRFNAPNDVSIDRTGRIYFTDPRYLGDEPRELETRAVYRIDNDGTVVEVTHEVEKPNGIALSPDDKTLYVVDHNNGTDRIDPDAPPPRKGAMKIYAFPLGPDGLVRGPRRTLVDFGGEDGCDGMTVDTHGNLYLAVRSLKRPGVLVTDPAGQEIGFLATGPSQPKAEKPVGLPSNCDFGIGDERNVLYVTVDKSLYRVRLNAEGYHIPWAAGTATAAASPQQTAEKAGPAYPRVNLSTWYRADAKWPERPAEMEWGHMPGVAVDGHDQVWLYTRAVPPVQVYDADGRFVRAWGEGVVKTAHHIKFDRAGNVWLADIGLHVVMQFTPEGKLLRTLGTAGEPGCDETHFDQPTDMAITPDGDVFISDGYGNNRIVHYDRAGHFVKAWGKLGTGPGEFSLPHAIALDSRGRLYVADRNNARVQVFDQDGRVLDEWRDLLVPWGFWVTAADDIWVCGSSPMPWHEENEVLGCPPKDQVFMRFDPSGRVRQVWTVPKGEDGHEQPGDLNWVHALALDSHGNIYAGDIIGKRAQKFVRQPR